MLRAVSYGGVHFLRIRSSKSFYLGFFVAIDSYMKTVLRAWLRGL